ncbi:organic hydroperoxide resistance protein [Pedomonas mirosovicensis]|uniref:organic hydroperoxide resistance protein n=1 Tax=Pedomonas mirosovicensis TaxID=2908641 RepID=UPI00216821B0|nr:organic hydroperoxide resistance protein [Pedomonas mirosovicensis]MCH8686141.1 organic hydroperoxide resistance protein [Pedomonas mirosovicensis]
MKTLYETRATATGGREGHTETEDGRVAFDLSIPEGLGGKGGSGANPEQLFAAGYAACFLSAVKAAAPKHNVEVPEDAKVTATVGIGRRDDGVGYGLAVRLTVEMPGIEPEQAEAVVRAAHEVCPYSHAIKGNVEVDLGVI